MDDPDRKLNGQASRSHANTDKVKAGYKTQLHPGKTHYATPIQKFLYSTKQLKLDGWSQMDIEKNQPTTMKRNRILETSKRSLVKGF